MTDINELVAEVKLATDYQINRQILREKIQTDLHFAFNGGLFKASPELIAFVNSWDHEHMVLEDTYGNPIEIENTKLFLVQTKQHYQQVMNRWHQQHAELRRIRKI
jgi:hypothetical protein